MRQDLMLLYMRHVNMLLDTRIPLPLSLTLLLLLFSFLCKPASVS